jgi:hypothetical protein
MVCCNNGVCDKKNSYRITLSNSMFLLYIFFFRKPDGAEATTSSNRRRETVKKKQRLKFCFTDKDLFKACTHAIFAFRSNSSFPYIICQTAQFPTTNLLLLQTSLHNFPQLVCLISKSIQIIRLSLLSCSAISKIDYSFEFLLIFWVYECIKTKPKCLGIAPVREQIIVSRQLINKNLQKVLMNV